MLNEKYLQKMDCKRFLEISSYPFNLINHSIVHLGPQLAIYHSALCTIVSNYDIFVKAIGNKQKLRFISFFCLIDCWKYIKFICIVLSHLEECVSKWRINRPIWEYKFNKKANLSHHTDQRNMNNNHKERNKKIFLKIDFDRNYDYEN